MKDEQRSYRDQLRSYRYGPGSISGTAVERDASAMDYAFSLSKEDAAALAEDLSRLRESDRGMSSVGFRLLRVVQARQKSSDLRLDCPSNAKRPAPPLGLSLEIRGAAIGRRSR